MVNYEWSDKDPLVLVIEGNKINLDTKGVEYAKQFGRLTSWLGRYAIPALISAAESGTLEGTSDFDIASRLLSDIMNFGLTPESMIELASIIINKDEAFVEEFFDPGWFVEALLRSYDSRPGVRVAFARLYERFFLAKAPDTGDAEGKTSD
jgi:hypothetical protein